MYRLPRSILVFWLMGLNALVNKMSLLITIVTGDLTQVLILPFQWSVVVSVVPSKRIGYIDPSG